MFTFINYSYKLNQVHMHTIPIDINQLGSYFGSLHKGPIKSNINCAIRALYYLCLRHLVLSWQQYRRNKAAKRTFTSTLI